MDRGDAAGQVVMLPYPHDSPTRSVEPCVDRVVTGDVPIELAGPVVRVGPRFGAVHGAPMPEATINEDSETIPREHDVRSNRTKWRRDRHVAFVSESGAMQRRPEPNLRRGIASMVALHDGTHASGRRWGSVKTHTNATDDRLILPDSHDPA